MAYDLDRHDWRSFRLDRLTEPRGTGARFRTRELPTADAAEFVRAGVRRVGDADRGGGAGARAGRARARAGRPVGGRSRSVDQQRCLLRMSVDSLDWPMLALGSVGAEFEVGTRRPSWSTASATGPPASPAPPAPEQVRAGWSGAVGRGAGEDIQARRAVAMVACASRYEALHQEGARMAVDLFLVIPVSTNSPITADPGSDPYFRATFAKAAVVQLRQFSFGAETKTLVGSASGAGAGKMHAK